MRWARQTSIGAVSVAVALAASACGSLGEPYLGSFPTSSTSPIENEPSAADGGSSSSGDPGGFAVEALPPRPPDYLPSIVVISGEGIGLIERRSSGPERFSDLIPLALSGLAGPEPDPEPEPEPEETTTTAPPVFGTSSSSSTIITTTTEPEPQIQWTEVHDDLFGGLVLQADTGEIMWFPGTGGEPRMVEVEGELLEVGFAAGTPETLSIRAGQITRTRLIDNDVVPFAALQLGEEIVDLSSSGAIVAIARSDDACGSVSFLRSDGMPLTIDPFGVIACDQNSRPTVGAVALSPDGEAVAYTLIEYREDGVELETTLRAVELTSGAQILDQPIGASGEVVESLAFDGSTAVVLRRSSSSSNVVVATADSVEVIPLDLDIIPRAVTFARIPLSNNLVE